jgi:phytoene/squalene synthetase
VQSSRTGDTTKTPTGLALYTHAAERSSREVIAAYSTSFGLASRLLGKRIQQDVYNIYALVRVADEIVDGSAEEARLQSATGAGNGQIDPGKLLDQLEAETYLAMRSGFSTNLVVHAFAHTANRVGFGKELVQPFFASMRMDLTQHEHDEQSFKDYVYGSAEVVGLMCLKAFVLGQSYTDDQHRQMIASARALGSAFQKVNFLRDLAADFKALGRSYFPGVSVSNFDEESKRRIVVDIQQELDTSAKGLRLLPKDARKAVVAAQLLFEALNTRLNKTAAAELTVTRIRVPNPQKLWIAVKAWIGVTPR